MSHTTEIVEYRKLSDSEFAVCIACCGEHLHWHTMHASVVVDPEKKDASILQARELAATNHEAAVKAEEHLKSLVGSKVAHD